MPRGKARQALASQSTLWRTEEVHERDIKELTSDGRVFEVPARLLRRVSGDKTAEAFKDLRPSKKEGGIRKPYVTLKRSKTQNHAKSNVSLVPVRAGFCQTKEDAVTHVILHADHVGRTLEFAGLTFEPCDEPIFVAKSNWDNRLYSVPKDLFVAGGPTGSEATIDSPLAGVDSEALVASLLAPDVVEPRRSSPRLAQTLMTDAFQPSKKPAPSPRQLSTKPPSRDSDGRAGRAGAA